MVSYIATILPLLLFLIMLGMGTTLTIKDFKRVVVFPKAVFIGLANQIILLPLIGLFIISVIPMEPYMKMGVMVVAACPGGATSNLISHLSKGDTALSITLTAMSSMITIISIPLVINLSLWHIMSSEQVEIQLPFWKTVYNIFKLTALPVLIGLWFNNQFPKTSKKIRPIVSWGSVIIVVLALALMVAKLNDMGNIWTYIRQALLATIVLNILTLTLGFSSSRLFRLDRKQSITIAIETGLQNNVLGMALATSVTILNAPEMGAAAGVYGLVMCLSAFSLIYFFRKMTKVG